MIKIQKYPAIFPLVFQFSCIFRYQDNRNSAIHLWIFHAFKDPIVKNIFIFMHYFYLTQVCKALTILQSFDLLSYLRNQCLLKCSPHEYQSILEFSFLSLDNFYQAILNMDRYNTWFPFNYKLLPIFQFCKFTYPFRNFWRVCTTNQNWFHNRCRLNIRILVIKSRFHRIPYHSFWLSSYHIYICIWLCSFSSISPKSFRTWISKQQDKRKKGK